MPSPVSDWKIPQLLSDMQETITFCFLHSRTDVPAESAQKPRSPASFPHAAQGDPGHTGGHYSISELTRGDKLTHLPMWYVWLSGMCSDFYVFQLSQGSCHRGETKAREVCRRWKPQVAEENAARSCLLPYYLHGIPDPSPCSAIKSSEGGGRQGGWSVASQCTHVGSLSKIMLLLPAFRIQLLTVSQCYIQNIHYYQLLIKY